jgi:periplasmic divalent cation tolerance protein
MAHDIVIAQTTSDDEGQATMLARGAVESKLAAGVHIDAPITAFYWWKGKVEAAREWRISYMTTTDRLPALEALVRRPPMDHPARNRRVGGVPVLGLRGDGIGLRSHGPGVGGVGALGVPRATRGGSGCEPPEMNGKFVFAVRKQRRNSRRPLLAHGVGLGLCRRSKLACHVDALVDVPPTQ